MDRDYIQKNHIVDRYVMGQLSEEETDRFQLYYFEHPEVLQEIALARSMLTGLQENTDLLSEQSGPSFLQTIIGWLTTPAWALAAPVAALAIGAVFLAPMYSARDGNELADYSINAELYLIRTRGTSASPPVSVHPQTGLLLFAIDVAGLKSDGLRGEIRRSEESAPFMTIRLAPDDDGLAQTVVPANQLAPGDYELKAVDRTGASLSYPFKIADGLSKR